MHRACRESISFFPVENDWVDEKSHSNEVNGIKIEDICCVHISFRHIKPQAKYVAKYFILRPMQNLLCDRLFYDSSDGFDGLTNQTCFLKAFQWPGAADP